MHSIFKHQLRNIKGKNYTEIETTEAKCDKRSPSL